MTRSPVLGMTGGSGPAPELGRSATFDACRLAGLQPTAPSSPGDV
ncbi:MAG: hypothetical protein AVDCRST_MAG19-3544 [uncultured Thermomicrobiales bacterium]|uniref:Uncharacterized protein n=1 Tax=uncultured Thermomicrobiales bacterium TaxID=1645740 RepID=A0A6J4VG47_9BACT|nr:MAG: hypothetical protein AVDCRST_MAG19-3544 [uncultured Thermomicrobiales bacterium]